jgi:hypothetical protein
MATKMDMDLDGLRERFAWARRGRDLEAVSLEIGVYASSLQSVEDGEPPQFETLAKLCAWLGTTMDEFVR